MKAMAPPSGDQAVRSSEEKLLAMASTRTSDPSAFMTRRFHWLRPGSSVRKAIRLPSGDQLGPLSRLGASVVSRVALVPSAFITQMAPFQFSFTA